MILEFPGGRKDPAEMTRLELSHALEEVLAELADMDAQEPGGETSEEFVDWAEAHEDLEDLADELTERLEELS